MRKTEIKYILLLLAIFATYVLIENGRPKPIDWRITFSAGHKIPFGGMVAADILKDHFNDKLTISHLSAYEILDTLSSKTLMVQSNFFATDEDEMIKAMRWVEEGSTLLISSEYLDLFADTLGYELSDMYFDTLNLESFREYDSTYLQFVNPEIRDKKFWYARPHLSRYFDTLDSLNTKILAVDEGANPVIVERSLGQGRIILSLVPMALTNYYLLRSENYHFADYLFSYLDSESIHWTEFYQTGRLEPQTPLRYLLSQTSLRWAYYLTIISILLFIFFRAKRMQRIIPIIIPLKNASREFTKTLGNLYMHREDHSDAAEKKITYFMEYLRSHYYMNTNMKDEEFYDLLAKKSGKPRRTVDYLFKTIIHIQSRTKISKEQLIELNTKIDEFYSLK